MQSLTNDESWDTPPVAPVLQGKGAKDYDFFVDAGDLEANRKIKLMVEFPTNAREDKMNDISLYFKRFATVLLAAHSNLSILNWEHPAQNPITKAIDILPNEESIKQYSSGM